jgi:hypothetical protein
MRRQLVAVGMAVVVGGCAATLTEAERGWCDANADAVDFMARQEDLYPDDLPPPPEFDEALEAWKQSADGQTACEIAYQLYVD